MAGRGARLSKAMRARGRFKQHALAVALGVNESSISRWKDGGRMSLENAIALCRELDISLDWFLTGAGSMYQHKVPPPREPEGDARLWSAFRKMQLSLPPRSRNLLIELIESFE